MTKLQTNTIQHACWQFILHAREATSMDCMDCSSKIYQSVSSKIMWRFQTPLGAECCKPSHNFWHPFPYIKQFPCSMLSSYILISNLNNLRNRIPTLYIYHTFALLSFYHRQLQLFWNRLYSVTVANSFVTGYIYSVLKAISQNHGAQAGMYISYISELL